MGKKHRYDHANYEEENRKYKHFVCKSYGSLMGEGLEERFVLSYEELESVHLSNATPSAPLKERQFQVVQNYFLDYWTHILSNTDVVVLQSLKRWAYDRNFTIMPISELAKRVGVSRNTLKKSLKTLEDNFFILQIQRKHIVDDEKKNNDAPAMFLIRDTVPLLDKWQVKQLPEFLQEEHDNYLNYMYESLTEQEGKGFKMLGMKSFVREFLLTRATPDGAVERKIAKIIEKHGFKEVVSSCFAINEESNERFIKILEEIVAKPSYDMYLKDCVFFFEDHLVTIICKDRETASAINNNALLENLLKQTIEKYCNQTGYINSDKEFIAKTFTSYYLMKNAKDSY